MTFDEWFDKEYPEGTLGPIVIRLSFKEVAKKAWDAAYAEGYDTCMAHNGLDGP